jgi:hypothetical protein
LAVSTSSAKVFEYWMISSLKIKLNEIIAGNFEELVCAFGVVGKIFIW